MSAASASAAGPLSQQQAAAQLAAAGLQQAERAALIRGEKAKNRATLKRLKA